MQGVSPQATVATVASCGVTVSRSQAEHATHRQAPGIHIFQSAIRSDSICICCECNDSEQAFAFACLLGGGLGASRRKRDLIYENMVTDDPSLFPVHVIEDYNTIMSHTRVSR